MPYKIHFVSLGCAKNVVNCEQMMARCQAAGHILQDAPEGADVAVVNTCGFLQEAKEEALAEIAALAERKRAGGLKKILVTGCMAQRFREELHQLCPEADGFVGVSGYEDIAQDGLGTSTPRCRKRTGWCVPRTTGRGCASRRAVTITAPIA